MYIIHPFLTAALIVVLSLNQARDTALPEEALMPLLLMELFTAVLFAVMYAVTRNAKRAGIICTLLLPWLFLYLALSVVINLVGFLLTGHAMEPWARLLGYILLTYIIAGLGRMAGILLEKRGIALDTVRLTSALNIVTAALLLVNLVPVAIYEMQMESLAGRVVDQFYNNLGPVNLNDKAPKRDVYYLILDGFPYADTLKEVGHFDDSRFLDYLKSTGFYLVANPSSNYDRTCLCLPSILSMQYLDDLVATVNGATGQNANSRMVQDSAVSRLFKKLGYKYITISCGSDHATPQADVQFHSTWLDYFSMNLIMMTPASDLDTYLHIMRDVYAERKLSPSTFLPQIAKIKGPKFVFIHSDISHAPTLFDANGNRLALLPRMQLDYGRTPQEEIEQDKFAAKVAQQWIQIIERTQPEPIIIVQSDHGWWKKGPSDSDFLKARMRILNACRFPGLTDTGLYPGITPVNTFRLLFAKYFGANLKLLPDRSFCNPDDFENGYGWKEVTGKIPF